MRNHNDKHRKTKIIVLSILLGLSLILFITSAVLRNVQTDATEENANTLTASVQNALVTVDADGVSIGIVPMASGTPSLQLTKNNHATYISSGSYVNGMWGAIMTNADRIRMQEVNGNSYDYNPSADRLGFSRSENGWYKLWAVQNNIFGGVRTTSGEYTVGLDTVSPVMTAYADGATVSNNSTVRHTVTYGATDNFSGVQYYYFSLNGGDYVSGGSGAILSADDVYKLYCVDRAGNSSGVINVTKDGTAPTARAYNGSSQLSNGTVTTAASIRFEATDNLMGVDGIYIRSPGVTYYTMYTGTAVTLSEEGTYYYYAKDKAGNQSSTYSVTVDRTAPSVQLYSGAVAVASGYYSAASYIRFIASDTNGCTIYMKKDGGSYGVYTSGTNITAEGVYSFYAYDVVGNTTATYTITLDRTAPVGTLYAGMAVVSSGKITNALYVTYTATDNITLSVSLHVRKPGASSYVSFTSGTQYTADGTYYFYATDLNGNASAPVSILLDRTKPTVTIYGGTSTMPSGVNTNKGYVSFTASDTGSGVAGMYVNIPDSSGYIAYAAGTPFYGEGTYTVYAVDGAGNESDTVTVTLDTTNPIGTIKSNGVTVPHNGYTNEAFSYTAADSVSGVSKYEVKYPSGAWEPYTTGAEIPANVGGVYAFRATDKAGNVSDESRICLITVTPGVIPYADEQPINGGTYTNAARIGMSAVGEYVKACYVKLPGASDFVPYTQYLTYTTSGRYEFYAEDYAGGKTETAVIIVDRNTKPVTINGASGGKAYGNVTLTWTDGDPLTVAPIVSVTVNGISYQKGNTIRTIDGGVYVIETTDAAGNIWTDTFTANRKEILSDTLNKQYYESTDGSGTRYAFESYDNALAFAITRESAFVRTGTWSGAAWDGGIPMDSIDSVNARNGEYYIYVRPDRA